MKSTPLLDKFFSDWQEKHPAITSDELNHINDTLKSVYDLYYEFYDPKNLNLLNTFGYEYFDTVYKNIRYAIVQSRLKFTIVDHFYEDNWFRDTVFNRFRPLEDTSTNFSFFDQVFSGSEPALYKDSITDFKPQIKNNVTPLYFSNDLKTILSEFLFLGNEKKKNGFNIGKETIDYSSIDKRRKYLNRLIYLENVMSSFFDYITYPEIFKIQFDKTLKRAKVFFSITCNSWTAYLEWLDGKWVIKKIKNPLCGCG